MKVSAVLNSNLKEGDHIYRFVYDPKMNYMIVGYCELEITSARRRYLKDENGNFRCSSLTIGLNSVVDLPHNYVYGDKHLSLTSDYGDVNEEIDVYLTEQQAIKAVKHHKSLRKKLKMDQKKYEQQIADYVRYIRDYQERIENVTKRMNDLKANRAKYLSECDSEPIAFVLKK